MESGSFRIGFLAPSRRAAIAVLSPGEDSLSLGVSAWCAVLSLSPTYKRLTLKDPKETVSLATYPYRAVCFLGTIGSGATSEKISATAGDMKRDIICFVSFVDRKEAQFTNLIGSVLVSIVISAVFPSLAQTGKIPMLVVAGFIVCVSCIPLAFVYFLLCRKYKKDHLWVKRYLNLTAVALVILGVFFFVCTCGRLVTSFDSPGNSWYLRLNLVMALQALLAFLHFRREFYGDLHDEAWGLLYEIEEYDDKEPLVVTIKTEDDKVVKRRVYVPTLIRDRYLLKRVKRFPWVAVTLTFLFARKQEATAFTIQHE